MKQSDYTYVLYGEVKVGMKWTRAANYFFLSQQEIYRLPTGDYLQDWRGVKFVISYYSWSVDKACGKLSHTTAFAHAQKQPPTSHLLRYAVKPQCWCCRGESTLVGTVQTSPPPSALPSRETVASVTNHTVSRGHGVGLSAVILEGGQQ